jgi:hypothetical protein
LLDLPVESLKIHAVVSKLSKIFWSCFDPNFSIGVQR